MYRVAEIRKGAVYARLLDAALLNELRGHCEELHAFARGRNWEVPEFETDWDRVEAMYRQNPNV